MTCTTPLLTSTSGWMMRAVVAPEVTYCPVALKTNSKLWPPDDV